MSMNTDEPPSEPCSSHWHNEGYFGNEEESQIEVVAAETPELLAAAKVLIEEYIETLGVDLGFQNLSEELGDLATYYETHDAGAILLLYVGSEPAGCVALHSLPESDYINACEMKRLYVRPVFRGFGFEEQLADALIAYARVLGYDTMLVDTVGEHDQALEVYYAFHFEEIPPYYYNPLPNARYLKVDL